MIYGIFGSGLASKIDEKHWQGGFPIEWGEQGRVFDAIVLCATELQPSSQGDHDMFAGTDVICAPMDDATLTDAEAHGALMAAGRACTYLNRGKRVLVTCAQGRNRSGLVSAMILMMRRGMTGPEAVARVKSRRPNALTNESFVAFLEKP